MCLGLLGLTWRPWWSLWSSSHSPACTLLSRGAPVAWKDSSQSVTKLGDWASGGFPSAFQHRPLLPTHPGSGEQRTGPWLSSLSPDPHWAALNLKSEVLGVFLVFQAWSFLFHCLGIEEPWVRCILTEKPHWRVCWWRCLPVGTRPISFPFPGWWWEHPSLHTCLRRPSWATGTKDP